MNEEQIKPNRHVLVVDDDPAILIGYEDILASDKSVTHPIADINQLKINDYFTKLKKYSKHNRLQYHGF